VEYITGWPAAIIVMPTISKYVESLPSYHWVADIERGTMGKARAKKGQTEQSQEETQQQVPPADAPVVAPERIVEPVATAEVAVVETAQAVEETPSRSEWAPLDEENPFKHPPKQQGAAQRQPQKGRGATNSTRVDLAGLQGVRDQMEGKSPSVPQNVSPEGSAAVGGGDTAPVAAEPILSRFIVPVSKQHGPKQIDEISPYLLKKAIAKTLRIEPMPTSPGGNGEMFYIMSTLALVKHVPEINWAAVSADIIGLAKTERGKGFIATEEGGQLYLCVDCMMMKSFMDGEDADQREH
jgi:hypothetical protein